MEYLLVTVLSIAAGGLYYLAYSAIHSKVMAGQVKKWQKELKAQAAMPCETEEAPVPEEPCALPEEVEDPEQAALFARIEEAERAIDAMENRAKEDEKHAEEGSMFSSFMESLASEEAKLPESPVAEETDNDFDSVIKKLEMEAEFKDMQKNSQIKDMENLEKRLVELEKKGRGAYAAG